MTTFRRLFGILTALLLAGCQRTLLHATAMLAALGLLGSMAILRESVTTGLFAAGYLACWLVYYWLSIRGPAVSG